MNINTVYDPEFKPYGKVLEGYDTRELVEAMLKIELPAEGVAYEPGIDALEAFIQEIGMPSNFRELGIPDDLPWKELADSVTLTSGGYGHLTHEDVLKIFEECR